MEHLITAMVEDPGVLMSILFGMVILSVPMVAIVAIIGRHFSEIVEAVIKYRIAIIRASSHNSYQSYSSAYKTELIVGTLLLLYELIKAFIN